MTLSYTKSVFVPAFFILSLINNSGILPFTKSITTFTLPPAILHRIETHFSEVTIFPSPNLNSILDLKLFVAFPLHSGCLHSISTILHHIVSSYIHYLKQLK